MTHDQSSEDDLTTTVFTSQLQANKPAIAYTESRQINAYTAAQLKEFTAQAAAAGLETQWWVHGYEPEHRGDALAADCQLEPWRDLYQMRVDLSKTDLSNLLIDPETNQEISTTALTVEEIPELVETNNKAFSWHPEQSGLTAGKVKETLDSPEFSLEGIRLLRKTSKQSPGGPVPTPSTEKQKAHVLPDLDASNQAQKAKQLAGFCWTKIHLDLRPVVGEIYVIGLHPDFHGRRLGKPLTAAGLKWLADQGLDTAMLYVESDNYPAIKTYESIGFTVARTDRCFRRLPVEANPW